MRWTTALVFSAIVCVTIPMFVRSSEKKMVNTITLTNFQFTPKQLTVKAGTTVTWVNKEGAHTVSADDGSWESPTLKEGESFTHQFDKPGNYAYHCAFHGSAGQNMAGSIVVR